MFDHIILKNFNDNLPVYRWNDDDYVAVPIYHSKDLMPWEPASPFATAPHVDHLNMSSG